MTPNADKSADLLRLRIEQHISTFFVRIGDGAVECISGSPAHSCDGEQYTPELADQLRFAITILKMGGPNVLWGDWRTAVAGSKPNYCPEWGKLVDAPRRKLLNYEALLVMRASPSLLAFYKAVSMDRRKKVYIGAAANEGAAAMLNAGFYPLPMRGVFEMREEILEYLRAELPGVILFGAGMGGLIPIVEYWHQHEGDFQKPTCIHLGSSLDPVFQQKPTRSRQLPYDVARYFFKEIL